jgi:hypothetical protein
LICEEGILVLKAQNTFSITQTIGAWSLITRNQTTTKPNIYNAQTIIAPTTMWKLAKARRRILL